MESTFVIARRSKCRANVRHEKDLFGRSDRPLTNDHRSRIEPKTSASEYTIPDNENDDEIVLI